MQVRILLRCPMICHNCQHVTCPDCGCEHAECPKCKPDVDIAGADALMKIFGYTRVEPSELGSSEEGGE